MNLCTVCVCMCVYVCVYCAVRPLLIATSAKPSVERAARQCLCTVSAVVCLFYNFVMTPPLVATYSYTLICL